MTTYDFGKSSDKILGINRITDIDLHGNLLAGITKFTEFNVWNIPSKALLIKNDMVKNLVNDAMQIFISSYGNYLIVCSSLCIYQYNIENGKLIYKWDNLCKNTNFESKCLGINTDSGEQIFVYLSSPKTIEITNLDQQKHWVSMPLNQNIHGMCFSETGDLLVSVNDPTKEKSSIYVIDIKHRTNPITYTYTSGKTIIKSINVRNNLLAAINNTHVYIWNLNTQKLSAHAQIITDETSKIKMLSNTQFIINTKEHLRIFNFEKPNETIYLNEPSILNHIVYTYKNKSQIIYTRNEIIKIWDYQKDIKKQQRKNKSTHPYDVKVNENTESVKELEKNIIQIKAPHYTPIQSASTPTSSSFTKIDMDDINTTNIKTVSINNNSSDPNSNFVFIEDDPNGFIIEIYNPNELKDTTKKTLCIIS